MTPKDLFAAAVRVVGLIVLVGGLRYLLSGALIVFHSQPPPGVGLPFDYLVLGVLGVLLGAYFIRGAPGLFHFAFPSKDTRGQTTPKV